MKLPASWLALQGPTLLFVLVTTILGAASETEPAFDESVAREIVQLTEAAYCSAQLAGWNCTVCQSFPGMTNVSVLQGQSRNVRGFVGVDVGERTGEATSTSQASAGQHSGLRALEDGLEGPGLPSSSKSRPRIVVTFSGTDPKSLKNWIDDLEAAPIAHAYAGEGCSDCKVHRGFLAAYDVVQDQVRAAVAKHLRDNPDAEILITGHSLGGALATLCFLDLQLTLGSVPFAPVYIFGAPRVGNEVFAKFSVSHAVPIYRVVHNRDPVPHLPFESWGYRHPPTEVFFDADQTSYVVCDDSGEDETCSDQFWVIFGALHVSDHLSYLEVDYTKAYLQCLVNEERGSKKAAVEVEPAVVPGSAAMVA